MRITKHCDNSFHLVRNDRRPQMTTMQKFKAYFGMVPPSDYEDDYLEEPGSSLRAARDRGYRDDYDADYREPDYRETDYRDADYRDTDYRDADYRDAEYRDTEYRSAGFADSPRESDYSYDEGRRYDDHQLRRPNTPIREDGPSTSTPSARGNPRDSNHSSAAPPPAAGREHPARVGRRPTGTRPHLRRRTAAQDHDAAPGRLQREARIIGERYRDGSPVIMDLVNMSNDDAKRLVDFAAVLPSRCGSFDKVATKGVPALTRRRRRHPEDRRKIAETGFYNNK